MKVLILHQHFNTPKKGGAIRSYYLAKALVDHNIKPIVITAHNDVYKSENYEGIEVHYLPVSYNNNFGFVKRSLSFVLYIISAIKLASKYKNASVCYAISVPLTIGLAAIWIKKVYKIPFIFEVGDLWPEAPIQLGFIRNYFFKSALYKLEKIIYKEAESIVGLSSMINAAIEEKMPEKKIHLIPNMADTDFYSPTEKDSLQATLLFVTGKFVVSYIGSVGFANGLDYFLACAASSAKGNLNIHFILCGEGAMRNTLMNVAKELRLQNFTFIPFQNRDGVREIFNVTDASFVCYKNVPILETGSPNKYFDGLAAGKIIITNFGGWIKEEIEKEQCGISINPENADDFIKKISPFLENEQLAQQYKSNARALALKKYSRKKLGEEFALIFRNA